MHSRKLLSDNELLKNIKTVGEIRGAEILYINTGMFTRSVDLFFCLWISLRISSLSEEMQKNQFSTGAPRKFNGDIFWVRNIALKIGGYVWKIVIKYFGNDWGVTDSRAIVV